MKKSFVIIALAFVQYLSFSQNFNQLANYEFKTIESYETEKNNVLMAANFLFENPADQAELNRLTSIQYILKWMQGTPEYTFDIGEQAMELTKGNPDLLGLYLAAMSKVVLENRDTALNKEEIYTRAEEILVDYCAVSSNNMKPSKKIKKLIKSRKI
ncbi:hypothetical protein [Salinimicrobium xinjiangense]|uniref:hypothetical protein n=1 Tax=Salinimicrobium xinjiangense TaxID=438596 RepID=UPI000416CD0C|nr:hypothetical protein [Salinimicrobium xinjiangense]